VGLAFIFTAPFLIVSFYIKIRTAESFLSQIIYAILVFIIYFVVGAIIGKLISLIKVLKTKN